MLTIWNIINYFTTNNDAPKFRIVSIDLDARRPEWKLVVAESEETISGASIVGDKLIVEYLRDAASRAVLRSRARIQSHRDAFNSVSGTDNAGAMLPGTATP